MIPKKRKNCSAEFKAKVSLEAIQGVKTLEQIGSKYGIHPITVSKWKSELLGNASQVFERDKKQKQIV